jgi:hypothetical protein
MASSDGITIAILPHFLTGLPRTISGFLKLEGSPLKPLEIATHEFGIGDHDGNHRVRIDMAARFGRQRVEIDRRQPVRKAGLMIEGQTVNDQVGAPVHKS